MAKSEFLKKKDFVLKKDGNSGHSRAKNYNILKK